MAGPPSQRLTRMALALVFLVLVGLWTFAPSRYFAQLTPAQVLPQSNSTVAHSLDRTQAAEGFSDLWEDSSLKSFQKLVACRALGNCGPWQDTIVLVRENNFDDVLAGAVSGENIWARSVMRAMDELGMTYLLIDRADKIVPYYKIFPKLVKAIIVSPDYIWDCLDDWSCIKTIWNPHGVPLNLFHTFAFFPEALGPLGFNFTVTPEKEYSNFYLGYSIEKECMAVPYTPTVDRPRQVYILGKYARYMNEGHSSLDCETLRKAKVELNIRFVGAFQVDTDETLCDAIDHVGDGVNKLPEAKFFLEVAKSRALIGLGDPFISPTPWFSMCFGTPFLNPTKNFVVDPDSGRRIATNSQHNHAGNQGSPFAYNYIHGDGDDLIEQLRQAVDTPTSRYIPKSMTSEAQRARVIDLVTRDTHAIAKGLIETDPQTQKLLQGKDFKL